MADKLQRKTQEISLRMVVVVCITCNTSFSIRTTLKKDLKVDVCSHCHSFYLGTQKFESKAGRMERFRQMEKKSKNLQEQKPLQKMEVVK